MAPEALQAGFLSELAPCGPPSFCGFGGIVTANTNSGPVPSLSHGLDSCGNYVMVWLACPKVLSPDEQLLCGLQGVCVQRDGTNSPFGLAFLQMNLCGHEVNPLHLKVADLNSAHPGLVL